MPSSMTSYTVSIPWPIWNLIFYERLSVLIDNDLHPYYTFLMLSLFNLLDLLIALFTLLEPKTKGFLLANFIESLYSYFYIFYDLARLSRVAFELNF